MHTSTAASPVRQELQELSDEKSPPLVFANLDAIPNARDLLKNILEATSKWQTSIDQTSDDGQFLSVMRVIMLDFCLKNSVARDRVHAVVSERTYWVETAIPMFERFAEITGLIHFRG
jgi:hypothetical protein